jgi:hypothetical protein
MQTASRHSRRKDQLVRGSRPKKVCSSRLRDSIDDLNDNSFGCRADHRPASATVMNHSSAGAKADD